MSSLTSDRFARVSGGTKVSSFPETSREDREGRLKLGSRVRFVLASPRDPNWGFRPLKSK